MKLKNIDQINDELAKLTQEEQLLEKEFQRRTQEYNQFVGNAKARVFQIQGARTAYQQILEANKSKAENELNHNRTTKLETVKRV